MSSQAFLEELNKVRREYKFVGVDVDQDYAGDLHERLKEIGKIYVAQPNERALLHARLTSLVFAALDGIGAASYEELFAVVEDIHTRKNAGYAGVGADDPWVNFRGAEWFGANAFVGCLIRMSDKVIRCQNVLRDPHADQVNESLQDTLLDLAIYTLIAKCLLDEQDLAITPEPSWRSVAISSFGELAYRVYNPETCEFMRSGRSMYASNGRSIWNTRGGAASALRNMPNRANLKIKRYQLVEIGE